MTTVLADDGVPLWTSRSGRGPVLVLCHGGPGLWDYFDDVAALLGDDLTIVRWDQRGCGRSPHPGPYSIERSVADLHAVCRSTGPGPVAVLGHSWGALLALRYAMAHPDAVSHLVYVAGTGVDPTPTWRAAYEADRLARLAPHLPRIDELTARQRTHDEEIELVALLWTADFADPATARESAVRAATPFLGVNHACNAELMRHTHAYLSAGDVPQRCAEVRTPTLIVDGRHDVRPRSSVDSLAAALPHAARISLDAGHLPWFEQPEAFRGAVRAFVRPG